MLIKRGEILLIDLDPVKGSEQGKTRPCIVIQNDVSNEYSSVTIVAAITSTLSDKKYPTEVKINSEESGLPKESTILLNQIRTISQKDRVIKKIGKLSSSKMNEVNKAIKISLGL